MVREFTQFMWYSTCTQHSGSCLLSWLVASLLSHIDVPSITSIIVDIMVLVAS